MGTKSLLKQVPSTSTCTHDVTQYIILQFKDIMIFNKNVEDGELVEAGQRLHLQECIILIYNDVISCTTMI